MKRLLPQVSVAMLGHVAEKVIALVIITVLARHVDRERLGEFLLAISVCTAVAVVSEFGTARYVTRTISQDPGRGAETLAAVLRFRLPLLALALVLVDVVVAFVAPKQAWTFALVSVYVLLENLYFVFGAALLAGRAVATRVWTGLVGPVTLLAGVPAALLLEARFEHVLVLYALSSVLMVVTGFAAARRRFGPIPVVKSTAPVRHIVGQCSLIFAVNIVVLMHARLDEWMLAWLRDFSEVAGYATAYKLAEVSRTVIRPLSMVLVPVFAAAALTAPFAQVQAQARRALALAAAAGVAVAIVVIAVAPALVPLLFGSEYADSVAITRVLFLATPALFVGYIALMFASALVRDAQTLAIAAACLGLNFLLNLIAIPRWGGLGAAWTTLASESLFCVAMLVLLLHRPRTAPAPLPAGSP